MIKKLKYLVVCLVMLPCAAKADFDFLSNMEDLLSTVEYYSDKVTEIQAKINMQMQEFTDNRELINKLRKEAEYYAAMGGLSLLEKNYQKLHLNPVAVKGISDYVKGTTNNPELEKAIMDQLAPKARTSNDIEKMAELRKIVNELQIQNVSAMYAKAVVRRRQIMAEDKKISDAEKESDDARAAVLANSNDPTENLPQIMEEYKKTTLRANSRWKTILDATANYYGQSGYALIQEVRIKNAEEKDDNSTENQGQ